MSDHDPLDTRGQERQRAKRDMQRQHTEKTEESDIAWLMASKRGRRIVWRLLDQAGVFRLSFNTNAMQMAFAEGNRNSGNRLLSLVHTHCPELFPVMLKESANDNRNDD